MKYSLAFAAALGCFGAPVFGQDYPAKAARVVVPFPPGGGSDTIARLVTQRLTGTLDQPVVVDNRAGASGNIAGEIVAKSGRIRGVLPQRGGEVGGRGEAVRHQARRRPPIAV